MANTITAVFEVKTHEEYGSAGLAMVGREWADPFEGMAAAHDMLEHGLSDEGTQEEELQALGASFYVRDAGEYYRHKGQHNSSPARNIAADMPEQVHIMREAGKERWNDPGKVAKCDYYIEHELEEFVLQTKALMRSGFENWSEVPAAFKEPKEFTKAKNWLRKGYQRAQAQYANLTSSEVCELFEEIERKADKFLKYAQPDCGYQCTITVDLEEQTVTLTEIDPFEESEEEEEGV